VCVCVAISHGCDVTGFRASENEAAGRCSWARQQKDQRNRVHRCAIVGVERAPLCASKERTCSESHLHVQNSNAAGTSNERIPQQQRLRSSPEALFMLLQYSFMSTSRDVTVEFN
jgi:hypothetical protein